MPDPNDIEMRYIARIQDLEDRARLEYDYSAYRIQLELQRAALFARVSLIALGALAAVFVYWSSDWYYALMTFLFVFGISQLLKIPDAPPPSGQTSERLPTIFSEPVSRKE